MVQHRTSERAWWTLPGGKIEDGESAQQCAVRELREETGLVARPVRHLYDWSGPGATESCWLVDVVGGRLGLGHDPELPADRQELVDVAWMSVQDVRDDRQVALVLEAVQRRFGGHR